MGIQRRTHPPALKKQVVLELLKGEKTRNEICSQFEVHPALADKWKLLVTTGMEKLFTGGMDLERKRDKELIEELYKQVGKLTTQLEWLKKKMGYTD
jgi:transposase-like protein